MRVIIILCTAIAVRSSGGALNGTDLHIMSVLVIFAFILDVFDLAITIKKLNK